MRALIILGGLLSIGLLSACGKGVPACSEDCPKVSGTYLANAAATSKDKSSCGSLFSPGASKSVTVAQSGADLTTTNFWGLMGTIDSGLNATFAQVSAVTDIGEAASLDLSGQFAGAEGARTFSGFLTFVRTSDHCRLTVSTDWIQTGP